eukprot:TRINITY_DN5001_c0_g1_i1.p2 TRINITY_DN5001_c0_g1~~TRINITY_DN5001_c0_g1_i1.p2  ORF type:complete len:507 (-),score=94.53 TRINITY_DN5001_c0_g1_i1:3023-4396(-)
MKQKENLNIALAINDFNGHVDTDIMEQTQDISDVIGLNGGCSCCSLVEDLKAKVSFLHGELVDKGRISYLVIETSGITDPRNIIQILDQNFGKMYFIRLDCVVTVVDADLMYHSFKQGEELEDAAKSQIMNSDVTILNKIDLITKEELDIVSSRIAELAPTSVVYPTKYSQIPLPFILDIEDKTTHTQAVSHDRTQVTYHVSKKGKSHRKEKVITQPTVLPKNHKHSHAFDNVLIESNTPVVQWKFQEFLKTLDPRVVRVKGMLFFSHNPNKQFLFHLSGRQRYEIVDNGRWDTSSRLHLVFIGRNIDKEKILADFNATLLSDTSEKGEILRIESGKSFSEVIRGDKKFEVHPKLESQSILLFRLTGYLVYSMSKEQAVNVYGVNLNKMNETLIKNLNSAVGTWFFGGEYDEEHQYWLSFEEIGTGNLEQLMKLLTNVSNDVLELFYGNICGCKRHW